MLTTKGGNLSASISVAFPPEQYPGTIQRATEVFARFGDIARIDMTLGIATGRLLVTFFDIRSAQEALEVFRDKAENIPPAAYDFHAVSIAFAEWPTTVTSFRSFGEIAGASICGEDMLVEFYDMRAAQQVFFSVPGCRPWPPQNLPGNQSVQVPISKCDTAVAKATATAAAKAAATAAVDSMPLPPQTLFHTLKESLARVEYALDAVAATSLGQGGTGSKDGAPCLAGAVNMQALAAQAAAAGSLNSAIAGLGGTGGTPWPSSDLGVGRCDSVASFSDTPASIARSTDTVALSYSSHTTASTLAPSKVREPTSGGTTSGGGPGKPVREKVKSKDLTKFDIIAENVLSGEDERTTIMVRNIAKTCSREHFVEFLNQCGLEDKYTFFYMPFDKRRNTHCGLAFVNLKLPQDVIRLHMGVETLLVQRGQNSAPPAVSYARLQGDDQLMKHFSLSAVMNGTDVRKRPMFLGASGSEKGQESTSEHPHDEDLLLGMPAKVAVERHSNNQNGCANAFLSQAVGAA